MAVAHPLTLTGTKLEPQLSRNMTGHTTRIASKKTSIENISQKNIRGHFFRHVFLLGWLRIATNAFLKSLVVMPEIVPFDTHRNNNSGATAT